MMYKTTVKIDGMMCGMCESHINDAIRAKLPVKKVSSSHKRGETVIISAEALSAADVAAALEGTGYTVTHADCAACERRGLFGWK